MGKNKLIFILTLVIFFSFSFLIMVSYATSTPEELKFIENVANQTGILFDPTYTGKSLYNAIKDMNENPLQWKNRKVLFVHTGGLLSMYDWIDKIKADYLHKNIQRFHIDDKTSNEVILTNI